MQVALVSYAFNLNFGSTVGGIGFPGGAVYIRNDLILETRWPLLASLVLIIAAARFLEQATLKAGALPPVTAPVFVGHSMAGLLAARLASALCASARSAARPDASFQA